jgi:1,4-alpha-glucan branching enzyme
MKKTTARKTRKTAPAKRSGAAGRKTVTFQLEAPHAGRVDYAGTLTQWELKPMKRGKDGTWKTTFRPQQGTYEYKFLVDHQWIEDPANHERTSDNHGGFNSVCRVEAKPS